MALTQRLALHTSRAVRRNISRAGVAEAIGTPASTAQLNSPSSTTDKKEQ
jgi:hypothetical protein